MNRTTGAIQWDERYKDADFAYGTEPNIFFKEWVTKFIPGEILMPADGEGRNGIFAAKQGWRVTSFDISREGQKKALQLARLQEVSIQYYVGDLEKLRFETGQFDAIGLIYAHFPAEIKSSYHKKLVEYLKPGGVVIFEGFSKAHIEYRKLNPKIGGPSQVEDLFSLDEIAKDFDTCAVEFLQEVEVNLHEGKYHQGTGSVVRFVGKKV